MQRHTGTRTSLSVASALRATALAALVLAVWLAVAPPPAHAAFTPSEPGLGYSPGQAPGPALGARACFTGGEAAGTCTQAPAAAPAVQVPDGRAQPESPDTLIDTTGAWDGSTFVWSFGMPNTATYGQVVTVPAMDPVLQGFTFYISQLDPSAPFRGYVMAWDAANLWATGPILYESGTTYMAPGGGWQPITFSPPGGLALSAGSQYVLFASVSRFSSPSGYQGGYWELIWGDPYPGGGFYWLNNGADPSQWTSQGWSWFGSPSDLAFQASFASLPPDLALTKTESIDPVVAPGTLTYTVTVQNVSANNATGVVIHDALTLPAGVTVDSVTPSQGAWDGATGNWSVGSLAGGVSATLTIVLDVDATAVCGTDVISDTATVTEVTEGDSNPANDIASESTSVSNPVVDLQIEKETLAASVIAGEGLTYTITVLNAGPGCAANVPVTDIPDAGLDLEPLTPEGAVPMTCGAVSCTIPALAPGETAEIVAAVQVPASTLAGTYTNTACTASGGGQGLVFDGSPGTGAPPATLGPYTMTPFPPDGRPTWNNVTDVPGPTGSLLFDRPMMHWRIGDPWATWSHGYSGDVYYSNGSFAVTIALPPDTGAFYAYVEPDYFDWYTVVATAQDGTSSGPISVNGNGGAAYFGFYSPGGAPLASITINMPQGISDFAVGEFGIAAAPECAAAPILVTALADVSVVKTGPAAATAGDLLTYTLTVHNAGPSDAQNVLLTDTLPAGVLAVTPLTFDLETLPAGATVTREVVGRSDPAACYNGQVDNTVQVDSGTPDPDPANNTGAWSTAIAPIGQADLQIEKQALAASVTAGEELSYAITVINAGPSCAGDVEVLDLVPPGTHVVSMTPDNPDSGDEFCSLNGSCSLGALPGATGQATIDLVLGVDPAYDGTQLVNQAQVSADDGDSDETNNVDTVTTTVLFESALAIDKTALADRLVAGGEPVQFSILVSNGGPSDARDLLVTDELDPRLTLLSLTPGPAVPMACGTVSCTVPVLPAGSTAEIIALVSAPSSKEAGAYYNRACIPGLPCAEAPIQVVTEADLAIDKTGPATATAGDVLTYTVTVHNNGPSDAQNVVLTDTLPYGVVPVPGQPLTFSLGTVAAGETVTREVVGRSDAAACYDGQANNTVAVASGTPDPDPTNNAADWSTTILSQASLAIAKQAIPNPATAGGTVDFKLTVTNNGPGCATGVTVNDLLGLEYNPAGLSMAAFYAFESTQGTNQGPLFGWWYTCSSGGTCHRAAPMPPGVVDTIELIERVSASTSPLGPVSGLYRNFGEVVWDSGATSTYADWGVVTAADLSVDKVDLTDPVAPTEGFVYQIAVANDGPSDAQNVVISDTLDANVTFSTASPGCEYVPADHAVYCTLAEGLPAGSSTYFLLAVFAGDVPSGMVLRNDVAVGSDTEDPDLGNNSDFELTTVEQDWGPSADLAIQKTAAPGAVTGDEAITYHITVTNGGPQAATNVEVLDYVPNGATIVSVAVDNPDFGYEFCNQIGTCYLGTVYRTTVARISMVVKLDAGFAGDSLTNMAVVSGDQRDLVPDNNLASATVSVGNRPFVDLALDKSAPATVNAGGILTYTLAVFNSGDTDAAAVVVTDTLPAGVTLATPGAGCAPVDAATVRCTLAALAAGDSHLFTLVVEVDQTLEPGTSLENRAVVAAATYDYHPADNVDTADTSIVGGTDLELSKTGPEWVLHEELVTYTIVVTNYGPSLAQSVDVKDDLPAGIDLVSAAVERTGAGPALCGGLVCQAGDMAVGERVTVTVVGRAQDDLPSRMVLTNTATVFSDTPEDDLSNNTDDHTVWVHSFNAYLPVIYRHAHPVEPLPDLVGTFTLVPDKVEYQSNEKVAINVTVTNQGTAAAGPFWVDFYLNPSPVPTGPNLPWNDACSLFPCYGLTWEVSAGLAPGASVTLTSTPASYDVARSLWPGYFAPGTTDLYLHVDSWSPGSPVGAVLEGDEGNNLAERHGLIVAGGLEAAPEGWVAPSFPPR